MAAMTVLLVLLWLGVTTSLKVDLQKRVIGGQPCRQDERRYHVLLVKEDSKGQSVCGGSLLRNGWILTAAHCWESGQKVDAYLGLHLGNRVPIRIPLDTPEQLKIYKVEFWLNKEQHDLMLLKLPDTATIPHGVTTIQLPDCSHRPKIDDEMQIAGQGSTSGSVSTTRQPGFTRVLQCGNINKVSCNRLRQQIQAENSWYIHQHWFCGQTPGVDLCFGDSGGGVEYKGKIYGVNAFTGDKNYPCRAPVAFMDLCHQEYLSWIENTIGPAANLVGK
ncbi:cationic trypsin-like [Xiphophorus hellerii]|uniref:cationic trypsin-like n=1 Tax=Xiphophorus hellerii TaxID=8084 RepID=UPI0013B3CAC8|nr:cationic trypsin-like [Xiphophorus hellerii]